MKLKHKIIYKLTIIVVLFIAVSTLHDIGKISISDNILNKKGKLTQEEYSYIKTQTEIGSKMLLGSNTKLLETAKEIAS